MTALLRWYGARTVIYTLGTWLVLVWVVVGFAVHWPAFELVVSAAMGVYVVALIGTVVVSRYVGRRLPPVGEARAVHSPVSGRWLALNSPATKVPSHGVTAHGQAYAIDLVAEPPEQQRPEFGGEMMRAPQAYPAFGLPVYSMIDGTVVRASGWRRDHRARSSWFDFAYLMVEGLVRELGGTGYLLGNHLVVRGDDGVYAALAHLQRGSLTVSVGERVVAGQLVGRCGNSGNSSEPHVHAQLMDRARAITALGLPMVFAGVEVDGVVADHLPGNNEHLLASEPTEAEAEQAEDAA